MENQLLGGNVVSSTFAFFTTTAAINTITFKSELKILISVLCQYFIS